MAVSLALPAVFRLSDLLLASLFLTFIGECRLVFALVSEALSGLVLGVHFCGHRAA